MQACEGLKAAQAELRRDDSYSEAQPLLAGTSLHPWVSARALGGGWGPRGWGSRAGA